MAVSRADNLRVAVYSHDTFGLGHLTRCTRLSRAVIEAVPNASVMLMTGSPMAHRFGFPRGIDYIKLPSVVKIGPDTYAARDLTLSNRRVREMRSRMIQDAVDLYRPHLLLVDNVPLGMKGELLPTLERVKRQRPQTRVHLNLRDVLDDPAVIRAAWEKNGTVSVLDKLFDEISVFGSPEIYDALEAYDLPYDKTRFMGYLTPYADERNGHPRLPASPNGGRRILVTAGGGGDGVEIFLCAAKLQQELGAKSPYQFHLVSGPLMAPENRAQLDDTRKSLKNLTLHEFVQPLPAWMKRVDLVLSMGGYNTLCEVMSVAKRSVVVPRIHPRREQEIRARALELAGVLTVHPIGGLATASLDETLRGALELSPHRIDTYRPPMTGIERFKERVRTLADRLAGSPHPTSDRGRGRATNANRDAAGDPLEHTHLLQIKKPRRAGRGGTRRTLSRFSPKGAVRNHPPGSTLLAILLPLLLLLGAPAKSLDPMPNEAQTALRMEPADNSLNASDAERGVFKKYSPEALIMVDRLATPLAGLPSQHRRTKA